MPTTTEVVVHLPANPRAEEPQRCLRCGLELSSAEAMRAQPMAYWDPDKVVAEYRPGFDGSSYSLRSEGVAPAEGVACDTVMAAGQPVSDG